MALPSICIVTAAQRDNANAVWEARGRGPNNFSRKLCELDPGATYETPATHYLIADSSTTQEEVAIMMSFQDGDLPPLPDGTVWGEEGIISAADAMTAINGANMQVYAASGDVAPVDHAAGILSSRDLMLVPDPPL